jgi:hypothetical protein
MAFKGSVHRGTPVNHIHSGGAGIRPATPKGFDGTQPKQFESEKSGYRDEHATGHGTAYGSVAGNPGDARVASQGRYGVSPGAGGVDMNNPAANGKGVVLDGANEYANGYRPRDEKLIDSPVPTDAPVFDPSFIGTEDRAHAGSGNEGTARDNLLEIGGVMSRGQVGSSSRNGPENELLQDDQGGLHGHATQSQPRGGVKHLKE